MSNPSEHPPHQKLVDFGLGKLGPDQTAQIEEHLDHCEECHDTLLNLNDDTFTGLVRSLPEPGDVIDESDPVGAFSDETDGDAADEPAPQPAEPTDGAVKDDSVHAATMLVQSGEAIESSELPDELKDHPRYRIVERIGSGGMGDVFRAEHRLMNRSVALKLINSQLVKHPQAVERFRREVQAAAQLTHPNIVTAFDAEQAGNVHFLAMEFVEGTDLATVVKRGGEMPVAEACDYIRQAAEGLQHAHEKGMVHRDIKPHNLMLSPDGQIRILDFGLAGFATESAIIDAGPTSDDPGETTPLHLTKMGSVMGTPDYIAPEQARDAHSADIRADIYSLGCTLYCLLTGEPPHKSDSVLEKLKAHAEVEPEAIENVRVDVPNELAEVVRRMMSKDPADRFQTPADVADALAPFVDANRSDGGGRDDGRDPRQADAEPPRRPFRRFILLSGIATLLGAVVYIATTKGNFEVRSEVDGVEVIVRSDGSFSRVLRVDAGKSLFWLPADRFQVKAEADTPVSVTWETVRITWTGRHIIEVRRAPKLNEPDSSLAEIQEVLRLPGHRLRVEALAVSPDGRRIVSGGQRAPYLSVFMWDAETGRQIARVPWDRENGSPRRAAFSSDGSTFALSTSVGRVVIYQTENLQHLRTIEAHSDIASSLAFVPDKPWFVSGGYDGMLRLWNLDSGEKLAEAEAGREALDGGRHVYTIGMSPDGQTLLAQKSADLMLWDVETLKPVRSIYNASENEPFWQATYSSDGTRAALTTQNLGIFIFDVASGDTVRTLFGDTHATVAFSSGNQFLAEAGYAKALRVWDLDTGEIVTQTKVQENSTLVIVPGGRRLVTSGGPNEPGPGGDYALRLWELPESVWPHSNSRSADTVRREFMLVRRFGDSHTHRIKDVAVVPSDAGDVIATASSDGTVRLWDVSTGKQVLALLDHDRAASAVAASPDGMTLATTDGAGNVRLWDRETGRQTLVLPGHDGWLFDVAFSADGKRLFVPIAKYGDGKVSGKVVVYDVATGERVRELSGIEQGIHAVAPISTDHVIVAGEYQLAGVWNVETGEPVRKFQGLHQHAYAVAVSPDASTVATGHPVDAIRDGKFDDPETAVICLWDVETGKLVRKLRGHTGSVNGIAWSPDGRFVISGSGGRSHGSSYTKAWDNSVRVWNADTGEEVAKATLETTINSLVVLSDGKHVVTGGGDDEADLRLWQLPESVWPDTTTIPPHSLIPERTLTGRTGSGVSGSPFAASADGQWLISADGSDKTARLWDTKAGQAVFTMPMDRDLPESVAISRDGKWAAVRGGQGHIDLWDLTDRKKTHQLDQTENRGSAITFSADGRFLVTGASKFGNSKGQAIVWDVESGQRRHTETFADGSIAYSTAIPGTNEVVLSERKFWRWNIESGAIKALPGFPETMEFGVDVSSDGTRAVVIGVEKTGLQPISGKYSVEVRDLKTGKLVSRLETGESVANSPGTFNWPANVCFIGNGPLVAAGYLGGGIRVWDIASGRRIADYEAPGSLTHLVALSDETLASFTAQDPDVVNRHDIQILRLVRREKDVSKSIEIKRLAGHTDMIDSLDFAPDGSRVVSGGFDKTLRVWDVGTGRQVVSIGTPDAVTAVNVSPDGDSAATGFHNGQVILWDLETKRDVQHFIGHTRGTDGWKTRRILAVAFSPDGSKLASGGDDAMVRVWDVATGEQSTALKNNGTPIESIAWASDGKRLLSSEYDGSMTWWDVESGEVVSQSSPDKANRWTALSPDDRRIVSRTGILDAKTFQLVRRLENVDEAEAIDLRFSDDGRTIVAGSGSGLVRVWDAETGEEVGRYDGQIGQASVVVISPDGRDVVFGAGGYWDGQQGQFVKTGDFSLRHWRLTPSGTLDGPRSDGQPTIVKKFAGHRQQVTDVTFSRDGQRILSVGREKVLRVWNADSSELLTSIDLIRGGLSVAISPNGRLAATGSIEGEVYLWDLENKQLVRQYTGEASPRVDRGQVTAVAFSPYGKRIAGCGLDGIVWVWDVDSDRQIARLAADHGRLAELHWSHNGKKIITGGFDWRVSIWDVESGQLLKRSDEISRSGRWTALSPDGNYLAAGDRILDIESLQPLRKLEVKPGVGPVDVRFTPDGRHVVGGCNNGTLVIWDFATGRQVASVAHAGHVTNEIDISPDGRSVITGAGVRFNPDSKQHETTGDYDLRLWRLPENLWPQLPTDLELIQGKWKRVALTDNGEEQSMEDRTERFMTFIGEQFTGPQRKQPKPGKFSIDSTTTPKQIDLHFPSGPNSFIRIQGIYRLDHDRLTIFQATDWTASKRPTSFETKPGDKRSLLVFERVTDWSELQGTWKVVALEAAGQNAPEPAFKDRYIVIRGDQMTRVGRMSEIGAFLDARDFRIDPTASPKTLDISKTNDGEFAEFSQSIYEVDGDTLRVCFSQQDDAPRPESFDTSGTRYFCFTLKREAE